VRTPNPQDKTFCHQCGSTQDVAFVKGVAGMGADLCGGCRRGYATGKLPVDHPLIRAQEAEAQRDMAKADFYSLYSQLLREIERLRELSADRLGSPMRAEIYAAQADRLSTLLPETEEGR